MNNTNLTSLIIAVIMTVFCAHISMAKSKKASSSPQVIMTGEIAKKVVGYNGATPVSISISNGRITSITALDNQETPAYFNKAKQKVFNQFIGKTVEEALKLDADVATGATYSSEALIKNIKMGLQQAKDSKNGNDTKNKSTQSSKKSSKAKNKVKKRMTR